MTKNVCVCVCVCIHESLCFTPETNKHYKLTIVQWQEKKKRGIMHKTVNHSVEFIIDPQLYTVRIVLYLKRTAK